MWVLDEKAARAAINFFERVLRHVKGEWAGQPFRLTDWQKRILVDIFGQRDEQTGLRRYRTCYIEVPRKNGKSSLAAGIALYLLFCDGEPGAEIYSAAADRDQASIIFNIARQMVESSPVLRRQAQIYRHSIVVPATGSVYRVLSADVPTKHGINAHGIIFDELHAQPNRELWDVLTTSTGARRQPLTVALTTAGYDRESICWEVHEYAHAVQMGLLDDPTFYGVIYAASEDDDWLDPLVWAKANPNLGISVKLEYLEGEARRARMSPAYQNTFRRLHLNQWTQQESRWLSLEDWDACAGPVEIEEGAPCYGGLDLASTSDLAAFVLCWPSLSGEERYIWRAWFWIPEENLQERIRRDRVPYDAWAREGYITPTPGNVIDYGRIVADITRLGQQYNVREIAFDRWGAFQVAQQLEQAGFTMVQFGQGFASMSNPTKELLRIILDRRLAHGGNPVLRWMADNVVVRSDPAGNVKPDKQKSREKIDGIVAGIMALDRAMRHRAASVSVYERRGILTL